MSDKTYKIVRLESENVKRLKAVAIEPNGNVIEVTGRNGAGKSSLLDAIYFALAGKDAWPSKPIRAGEDKARVTLDLGSLTVTRKFISQEDGTYTHSLIVESEEGARFQKPQQVLDAMVGSLTMDPLEFTRMKPREQFDALKRFVPDFNFDQTAEENDRDFKARTDVNRRLKEATAQADGIVVPDGTPDEPIDESALVTELQKAGEHNADIEARKGRREQVRNQIESRKRLNQTRLEKIESLRQEIAALESAIADEEKAIAVDEKRLADAGPLPSPIDPSDVRAKIDAARVTNGAVARKKQRSDLLAVAAALKAESDAMTKRMADREAEKQKAIAAAKMPVDGIGFGDGIVTLNGLPFDQASSAEQLRASIGLAMAANPRLRIILVRDGSLLDDESMTILSEMAEKHQVQCWVETVSSGRAGAIVIEDGQVKSDQPALEAAE